MARTGGVILLLLPVLTLSSCSGKSSSPGPQDSSSDIPRSSDEDLVHLKGDLKLVGGEALGKNLLFLLYDHVDFSIKIFSLDETGLFRFSIQDFTVDHVYSLHVLTEDYLYLGPIRFASDPEPHAAMRFEGGKGADLGSMTLSLDEIGIGEVEMPVVTLSGGFAVYKGMSGRLDEVDTPSELSAFQQKQEFLIFDGPLFHEAFLARPQDLAARAMAEHTSLSVKVEGRTGLTLATAAFEVGSRLLESLRYAKPLEAKNYSTASTFAGTAYSLAADEKALSGRLFWGQYLFQKHLLLMAVNILDGRTVTLPLLVTNQISGPQRPLAQRVDGGVWQNFDYHDQEENGFAAPLCLPTSSLDLRFSQPTKSSGQTFGSVGSLTGQVTIEYFKEKNGSLVQENLDKAVIPLSFPANDDDLILNLDLALLDPIGSGTLTAKAFFELWSDQGLTSAVSFQTADCTP